MSCPRSSLLEASELLSISNGFGVISETSALPKLMVFDGMLKNTYTNRPESIRIERATYKTSA